MRMHTHRLSGITKDRVCDRDVDERAIGSEAQSSDRLDRLDSLARLLNSVLEYEGPRSRALNHSEKHESSSCWQRSREDV